MKQIIWGLITCVMIAGCGGGSVKENHSQGNTANTTAAENTGTGNTAAGDLMQVLEASGDIPVLDRSQSLVGPDNNNNGIRDDIDQFIDLLQRKHQFNDQQRQAAIALARSFQSIQSSQLNKASAAELSQQTLNSDMCFLQAFSNPSDGYQLFKQLEGFTANTFERAQQYNHYNELRDGSIVRLPQNLTCP